MIWQKTSPKIIAKYDNGNHRVTLFSDGTKIKETINPDDDHFTYEFPESFDLKITDYCDAGCEYCHENSTKKGQHANLFYLQKMLDSCKPGTEIAIGGGNALAHPQIIALIAKMRSNGLVPSITVNQKHIQKYFKLLKCLDLAGIGVSLTDSSNKKDIRWINELGSNVVIHTIAGVLTPKDYSVLRDRKVLILGYKDIRRGHDNLAKHSAEIQANIEQLKKDLPMIAKNAKALSFDCLALKQLNPKECLGMTDEEFANIYQGDDYEMFDKSGNLTVGTMFIDAVKMEVARSSTAPMDKRYKFTGSEDIRELLAKSCEGYGN
jgi:organic radical activating enzyme